MNNITVRAIHGTKDSYTTAKRYPEVPVEEIIHDVKENFNRYRGGEADSTTATIDFFKPGYIFKDQMLLQFSSVENCREFEEAIKPHVEIFAPRKYSQDVVE